jgi:hypothetical protein
MIANLGRLLHRWLILRFLAWLDYQEDVWGTVGEREALVDEYLSTRSG